MNISRRGFIASVLLLPLAVAAAKTPPSRDKVPHISTLSDHPPDVVEFTADGRVVGTLREHITHVLTAPLAIPELGKKDLFEFFKDSAKSDEFTSYDFTFHSNESEARDNIKMSYEYVVETMEEAFALYAKEAPDSLLVSVTRLRWKSNTSPAWRAG